METIKVTLGCIALTVSQLVAAAGANIHPPSQIRLCCASVKPNGGSVAAPLNPVLAPTVKISPRYVSTYEPSIKIWVATPRLRVPDVARLEATTRLVDELHKNGSVEVSAIQVDPAWIVKYRSRSVLLEDPLLQK